MNYENKHRIESLAKAACPNNKKKSRSYSEAKRTSYPTGPTLS